MSGMHARRKLYTEEFPSFTSTFFVPMKFMKTLQSVCPSMMEKYPRLETILPRCVGSKAKHWRCCCVCVKRKTRWTSPNQNQTAKPQTIIARIVANQNWNFLISKIRGRLSSSRVQPIVSWSSRQPWRSFGRRKVVFVRPSCERSMRHPWPFFSPQVSQQRLGTSSRPHGSIDQLCSTFGQASISTPSKLVGRQHAWLCRMVVGHPRKPWVSPKRRHHGRFCGESCHGRSCRRFLMEHGNGKDLLGLGCIGSSFGGRHGTLASHGRTLQRYWGPRIAQPRSFGHSATVLQQCLPADQEGDPCHRS